MTIDALLTMVSGAAVLTFAMYADSEVGTSAVGYFWERAAQPPMSEATTRHRTDTKHAAWMFFLLMEHVSFLWTSRSPHARRPTSVLLSPFRFAWSGKSYKERPPITGNQSVSGPS